MHIRFALIAAVFTCGCGQGMEPEPDSFSTSMEPEPDSMMTSTTSAGMSTSTGMIGMTSGGSNMTNAANGTVLLEHTVGMTVTLNNISAVADEATLISQITAGLLAAAGGGSAEVTEVVIHYINVVSVYKSLPEIVVDAIIEAYLVMTGISASDRASVTVNNQLHSGDNSTRRLASDATVKAKVTNTAGTDVVQAAQAITQAVSLSAMVASLEATSSYAAGSLSSMTMDPVTTELSVTSKVRGTAAPPTETAIMSGVGNSIAGGATVSGISVTSQEVQSTTTKSSMEDNAPVASLLIAWAAVCCAFLMA